LTHNHKKNNFFLEKSSPEPINKLKQFVYVETGY